MSATEAFTALGVAEPVARALEQRAFETLTPVQLALLDPKLAGRDILVSAQTGSGKTVAFGFLLADGLAPDVKDSKTPTVLVITPTRELASQVRDEIGWLFAAMDVRVLAVTGGTSVRGEVRSLSRGANIVVGTPGRLLDHLSSGALDATRIATVVLDEADEMLDMGFRDELEEILAGLPRERRTIMLSATLPAGILQLAKRYQRDAVRIAIDPPGTSHENIDHVAHLVPPAHRIDAIVNLLLVAPDARTLMFVRTRADAADLAAKLADLGFSAAALTGEMAQPQRTATLEAFRSGRVLTLVATDVAARGLDVQDVMQVVHADLPGDAQTLTHRAGRTGRAGRKGTSVLIVPPFARGRAQELTRVAGVKPRWVAPPGAAQIAEAAQTRLQTRLAAALGVEGGSKHAGLAAALLAKHDATALVAALLDEVRWNGPCEARNVPVTQAREKTSHVKSGVKPMHGTVRHERHDSPRHESPRHESPRARPEGREPKVVFRVNFGVRHGATPARIVAMMCRRGNVRGSDVGSIEIDESESTFGVAAGVAEDFAESARRRDVREPHVRIERLARRQGRGSPHAE